MGFYLLLNILLSLLCSNAVAANPYPIQFSITEEKIVKDIPVKDKDFAHIIPGNLRTYIFDTEEDYYKDYQRSYYALTCKKGGWDCMRHYEILANGCMPYFLNLDQCNDKTMVFLPKELIKEGMNLPGVSYMHIDHSKFDEAKYEEVLQKMLEHTRAHLTTNKMAVYILKTINYSGNGNILYLSNEVSADYLRDSTLIGLKQLYGSKVVDVPKIEFLYKSYAPDVRRLYGKGMSYTKILDDPEIDRSNIEQRILTKEFDLVVYGSIHRGTPYHDLVTQVYDKDQILYICGEDEHVCKYYNLHNLFLRENH